MIGIDQKHHQPLQRKVCVSRKKKNLYPFSFKWIWKPLQSPLKAKQQTLFLPPGCTLSYPVSGYLRVQNTDPQPALSFYDILNVYNASLLHRTNWDDSCLSCVIIIFYHFLFFNHFCASQLFNRGLKGRGTMLKLSNTCNTHRSCCYLNYGMYKSEHTSQLLAQLALTCWLQWACSVNTVFCITHGRRQIKQSVINVPMHTEYSTDTRPKPDGTNQYITGKKVKLT